MFGIDPALTRAEFAVGHFWVTKLKGRFGRTEGTIVLVSHDRYILDALPQCIVEVGSGRAVRYLGNYEDYLRKKADEEAARNAASPTPVRPVAKQRANTKPQPAKRGNGQNGQNGMDATRLTEEIARFEEEQAKLSEELSRPDFYMTHPDPNGLIARYTKLREQVEQLYRRLDQALSQ